MENIKTKVEKYIAENLLFSGNGFPYGSDVSFLDEGIVDSTGVLELVAFVEETFHVTIDDQEITPDNFDSVNRLANFIQQKVSGSA